jgi:hypothetical protein
MSFKKSNPESSQGAAKAGSPGQGSAAEAEKPIPKHARSESMRRRMVAPLASIGVVAAVIAALLVGFGGQHRVKSASGRAHGVPGTIVPLPVPTTTTPKAPTPGAEQPATGVTSPFTRTSTEHTVTFPTTEPATTGRDTPRPPTGTVPPRRTTATGSEPTNPSAGGVVTTHPTPTTTVTTITVHPTPTTTATTTITVTTDPTGTQPITTTTVGSHPTHPTSTTTTTSTTVTSHPTPTTTTTTTSAPPPTTTTTTTPTGSGPVPVGLQEGAFVGAANPSGMSAFAAATHSSPTVASDYLPGTGGWAGMDGAGGSLNWLTTPWKAGGYTLSLGVPIIPTEGGAPVGTLATGATGAYNANFVTLAQTLVAAGDANAYLRLGWEFDGTGYTWTATTPDEQAAFAGYFQQIVTAMRSVPGEAFRFVWNPDAVAFTTSNVEAAWPGSAYVSVIGLDAYDQAWVTPLTPANEWNEQTLPALNAAHAFAVAQGKPIAIDEWGEDIRSDGHGLGDDPLFMNDFTAWMKDPANNVAYESYFNNADSGGTTVLDGGDFPNALAAFIADLG